MESAWNRNPMSGWHLSRRMQTDPRRGVRFSVRGVRFGVFEFDAQSRELWKNGRLVAVRPQPLKLLALLLDQPGEVVSREDIQRALWDSDTFIDFEQGMNHAVRELRAALGDAAESPRFIQTLPRRGYRFLGPVEKIPADSPSAPPIDAAVIARDAIAPIEEPMPSAPISPRRRWPGVAAAAFAVLAVTLTAFLLTRNAVPEQTSPALLAVRPFVTPAGDPISGVGLAHAISIRLGGVNVSLVPISVSGADARRDLAPQPNALAHVLGGEIFRTGDDVTVMAHLDGPQGARLWRESFRVRPDQLFDVEGVIAERVADSLRLRLAATDQERLRRRYTSNGAAYEEYLRGRGALVAYTPDGARAAIGSFERALTHDPAFAPARAGLAMAAADMHLRFAPSDEVEQWGSRAEAEARAALNLDADLADAHLARAAVARKREFDWNTTIEASRRALVLNPNLEPAHLFSAAAYYHLGYMDEARISLEKARRLGGPDVIEPQRIEALIALFSGDFAPARAHLEAVSRLSSQAIGDTYLALAYYYSGSADRGRAMLEELAGAASASTSARAGVVLASVLAAQGDVAGARQQLDLALRREYRDHHVAYGFGAAHVQLGDYDQGINWLRIAADTGFPCPPFFERDPLLEPLRRRAEYRDLLAYVRHKRDTTLSTSHP
jgi:DNA-binding winged helix-turn-helix (wHTH) protein/tetratricopeptide (TPR) repeat protein